MRGLTAIEVRSVRVGVRVARRRPGAVRIALVGVVWLTVAAVGTAAIKLDLVENTEILHNGAIFQQTPEDQPTGTGVFESIVRIDENSAAAGSKDGHANGYNTSGRPVAFDELTDPNFTRDLTLGELLAVEVDEAFYYGFRLDINEPGNRDAVLSVDTIQLFVSGTGGQTTTDVNSLGTLVFDLDALGEAYLKLDARLRDGGAPGSGTGDMMLYLPVNLFDGFDPADFLYLYSEFGLQSGMKTDPLGEQAGFEEWAAAIIPEPAGGLLTALATLVLLSRLHRRQP